MVQKVIPEEQSSMLPESRGFAVLEEIIDKVQALNPADKRRRFTYLTDHSTLAERRALKKQLEILLDFCENSESADEVVRATENKCTELNSALATNMYEALTSCRELEKSYRCLSLFFENTCISEVKNLILLNAAIDQVADLDNPNFINYSSVFLMECFDRLELSNSFSMIVIPGYLYAGTEYGADSILQKWGRIAHQNKAILITDFRDLDIAGDVIDLMKDAGHNGKEDFRSSIIMTCNYLLGRRCYEPWGEDDNLYVPGSGALAGKMYNMPIARLASPNTLGHIRATRAVHFDMKISELLSLGESGLVTMINKSGKVQSYSNRTLYNGTSRGLRKYSTIRLFHHISKVLIDVINRTAFEAWTSNTKQGLIAKVMRFLNGMQGHEMLIRNFRLIRCERELDNETNPMLYLEISFELAGSKDFRLSLQASLGDGSYEWSSEYSEL